MFKVLSLIPVRHNLLQLQTYSKSCTRTFLSQAYYCNELWNSRLNSPILQKVNLDTLYQELDQRFQRSRQITAVDVDIYANAVKDDVFIDELMDLVHKLRLTSDTINTLDSTQHAVVRALVEFNKSKELLLALDDRLNYGIFLDDYTANLLLDTFWKKKDYVAGSLVASQIMLQENFTHPITRSFSLLHCYNYLLKPGEWPQSPPPEEPEEEVKVRVKYLRNPYNDDHFDLKDPQRIVGKTLAMAAQKPNPLHISLRVVGLALYGDEVKFGKLLSSIQKTTLIKEIIDLLPDENNFKNGLLQQPLETADVQSLLEEELKESIAENSERDIADQSSVFEKWESARLKALEEQKKKVLISERLAETKKLRKSIQESEQRLWFFEKEEDIELTVEEHQVVEEGSSKQTAIDDDSYIPPEVEKRNNT